MSLYWVILSLLIAVTAATIALYVHLAIAALRKRRLQAQPSAEASPAEDESSEGQGEVGIRDGKDSEPTRIARRSIGLSPDAQHAVMKRVEELRLSEHLDGERGDVYVSLELAITASDGPARTSDRGRYDNVRIKHSDGRSAKLRVVTGRGGTGVDVRLVGAEPNGGLWTADGRHVVADRDHRIDGGDRLLVELLAEALRFG
jgi:hypothetical protein